MTICKNCGKEYFFVVRLVGRCPKCRTINEG